MKKFCHQHLRVFAFAFSCLTALGLIFPYLSDAEASSIKILNAWTRAPMTIERPIAIYFDIHNKSMLKDQLLSAQTPIALKTGLHKGFMENDVIKMQPVQSIEVIGDMITKLEPGDLHVMVYSLIEPLAEGDVFPLFLTFRSAGIVKIDVFVESPKRMNKHKNHEKHDSHSHH